MKTDVIQKTILVNVDGSILLLRRSDTDDRRPLQWDFPGGLLDPGESLEEGAIREVREESGISIENVKMIFAKTEPMTWSKDSKEYRANAVRMYYAAHTEITDISLSFEHSESIWVALDKALELLEYPRHKEVISYIIDNKLDL